ncbi:MAG: DEAD/DEAH box helicase [Planctomycetales bacterium]|nr:DEAD/DEAH box helicase [Planctomycetales bacterium]
MATTKRRKNSQKLGHSSPRSGKGKNRKQTINVFHQRLGSLTFHQAIKLLGEDGPRLMRLGSRFTEVDPDNVYLGRDLLRVRLTDVEEKYRGPDDPPAKAEGFVTVTLTPHAARAKELQTTCDSCDAHCHHLGAALEYLLDTKSVLGLAIPPDETVPLENLTERELLDRALAERNKRAEQESMRVRCLDSTTPWSDYVVISANNGKSYRVSLRGKDPYESFCTCPDFRTNNLGTCKHIMHVSAKVFRKFGKSIVNRPYVRKHTSLRIHYGEDFGLRFNTPSTKNVVVEEIVGDLVTNSSTNVREVLRRMEALETKGIDLQIYPDAEEYIQRQLICEQLTEKCREIRLNPATHPLRKELLSVELLPFQLDGIAFAASAGRAILADDMGLGKTIQGIGVAELLSHWAGISRVLVVCPASLKSQWRVEIGRFSGRSSQLVMGNARERREQFQSETFFTICNYEQVLRDLEAIETVNWDLVVLDEGQRIKNWESKTSNVIRSIVSPFRLVLSGTPLENNLGELYTVARFVDENRLGSAFRFFNRHRVVDDRGRTLGYQNLEELRENLRPILLRRTRQEVAKQLPNRRDEFVRITPTAEQLEIHNGQMQVVAQVIGKKFFTEMDMLRLRRALAMARMVCDSTYLVNQAEPEYSTKLERLHELLRDLLVDDGRKIIIFSEWKRMLDRVESRLDQLDCEFVRLDGSVPQKQRPKIVSRFQTDPECRVILMTNAGSTGLNLQAANVVINCDLPWNPAVLEQRIARAYRMGQKNPVHIYNMVTTDTIEEQLIDTLASKQNLADAAINLESEVDEVSVGSGADELRRRLERMKLPKLESPVDRSKLAQVESDTKRLAEQRQQISRATGDLISAAFSLANSLLIGVSGPPASEQAVSNLTTQLAKAVDRDAEGRPQMTFTLPDDNALRSLASTLASLLAERAAS